MNRRWPDEALSFGESVHSAMDRLGGVEFTRRAEADPSLRQSELAPALERLGFPEIEILDDDMAAMAAAAGVRAAGSMVAPWPLAAQLAALPGQAPALYLGAGRPMRLEHLDLFGVAMVVDSHSNEVFSVTAAGGVEGMPLDPFGVYAEEAEDPQELDFTSVRRCAEANIIMSSFYVLGALEMAASMAIDYAGEREQFGSRLVEFGAIQWRLSEIALKRDGLAELAAYTLWQFCERAATPADVLALRLAMLEATHSILSNAHQTFGAIGLCEEHDLAVIDRHLQPMLRRSHGVARTTEALRDAIGEHGFDGLFPIRPACRGPQAVSPQGLVGDI